VILKEQSLFYGDIPDDDPINFHDVEVGQGSPEELADAVEGLVTSAENSGMPRDGVQSLRNLMIEYEDVFRLNLGEDTPANVKALFIKLCDGAEPVHSSARKYTPPQLKFMRDKIRELKELNLAYKNSESSWASPQLILPEPGPDWYRMTVDLHVPNASTMPTAWPIPRLQDELHDLHGSEVSCNAGFLSWVLADTSAQKLSRLSFLPYAGLSINADAVLHVTRNATQHLQSLLVVMMDDIKSNIKVWLDDCLLHTRTEVDLLATLNFMFEQCQKY
jgi:hypothetical protein